MPSGYSYFQYEINALGLRVLKSLGPHLLPLPILRGGCLGLEGLRSRWLNAELGSPTAPQGCRSALAVATPPSSGEDAA